MSSRTDAECLQDIREATRRIRAYLQDSETTTFEQFLADTKTQDAVIRNLEVIGEATRRLSAQVREAHPEVPWKDIAGTRDRLIHHYFGVNLDIVWTIATLELPLLDSKIDAILKDVQGH